MSVTLTHVVAALASVTVVLSSAIPEVGGSDVAVSGRFSLPPPPATHADEAAGSDITAGSEFAHFGLSSAGTEVYHDDEFVGTPEEIYAKVNARLASLGLEKRGYVGNIIEHCSFTTIAGQLAGGQMFDTDRENVILRGGQGLATDCAYGPWKK
ncbi:uncharacterized protein K444DRAFT_627880 [Hyaloscypha bicolor E]|uniref:Uncharacterized protein n=1 Tax=Hyaloscypha bicolor E TaxID=1095630 RepID=A0A2J6TJ47_9HELO|nr:uncharacterized protein K444DRAFT_627880 [Hyaloscypha bicolor E]PMD63035.1 hypothetical protein K444DRAFT_627880 [Hyaloscypha bicolor E]